MVRAVLGLLLGVLAFPLACPMSRAQEGPRSFSSSIASDLRVVAELSTPSPYVGQQLSILYSLQSSRYPSAIDVQPQDYSGFWTEVVALPGEARTMTRVVDGRPLHEFLLRQVIAYPLVDGALQLPPLAVKIMFAGTLAPGGTNWDLEGASKPVSVRVRNLPEAPRGVRASSLLAGTLEGRLSEGKTYWGREIFLELQGTANLAFFRPDRLFAAGGIPPTTSRLVKAENTVQTKYLGGRREVVIQQFRKWAVEVPEHDGIRDLTIPYFAPETREWKVLRVEGPVPGADTGETPVETPPTADKAEFRGAFNGETWTRVATRAALAIIILVSGILLWRWRRAQGTPQHWATAELTRLEGQLPGASRAFLETAHRILERLAQSNTADGGNGSQFEECWSEIEKSRFAVGDPSRETCQRILKTLKSVLGQEKESMVSEPAEMHQPGQPSGS